MSEVTAGDAAVAIAAEGGDSALKLMVDIMEHNAQGLADTYEQLYLGEKNAHERTQERLNAALDQLDLIHRRVAWLLGGPSPDERWE